MTYKPLCLDHDDTRDSEFGHWTPVSESVACEAGPAH
jgi:hypothetical protein